MEKSEEKQIEEMARTLLFVLHGINCLHNCTPCLKCTSYHYAETLYNAGYRKQSEGEWEIVKGSDGKEKMVCTNCRHQQDLATFTYCPNCGASMHGAKRKGV